MTTNWRQNTFPTSAKRDQLPNEITPVSAEHSNTNGDLEKYSSEKALDLDLWTYSNQRVGSDGTVWLKVNLGQIHCVQQVVWYNFNGSPYLTWNCTDDNCDNCEGGYCSDYILTVSTEETLDFSSISDCRFGDRVKLVGSKAGGFGLYEMVIIGMRGKPVVDIVV